jgi:hypothetical protein
MGPEPAVPILHKTAVMLPNWIGNWSLTGKRRLAFSVSEP